MKSIQLPPSVYSREQRHEGNVDNVSSEASRCLPSSLKEKCQELFPFLLFICSLIKTRDFNQLLRLFFRECWSGLLCVQHIESKVCQSVHCVAYGVFCMAVKTFSLRRQQASFSIKSGRSNLQQGRSTLMTLKECGRIY